MARPGGRYHGSGDRDTPFPQNGLASLFQKKGGGQSAHPQLRALEVNDEVGLHSGGPGGRVEDIIQQRGAGGEGGVGQIEPGAGHAGPKKLVQNGAALAAAP